ncbi:MAG TPA: T9SS type B sorting domain-containing protein, partial [Chitinophagaceae bacterium]|nr:T9SS type B sorting domain-containing protein [Chitinophagaceae bacterium]
NDTSICTGQSILLDATNNNSTYYWQDGSAGPTYTVMNAGIFTVKVSENGCDTTGTIAVSTIAKPYTDLGKDTSICIGQQLVLNAFYEGASYLWQDGSVQQSFVASQAGLYTVQVRNQCGVATDSINMQVENCACKISIPNSFTPNSDGRNDLFRPAFQCFFSGYELKIFNRWGQLIYISSSSAAGWDGTFNGQPQPTGGYVYQITYKDELTKKSIRKSGTLLLVR